VTPLLPLLLLAAATPPNPCRTGGDPTACYLAHQDRYLSAFGLPSAESRRAAGDQVRRVMIFGRVRNPVIAIEFRRAPGREPSVAIYRPAPEGTTGTVEPAYEAAIPPAEWERVGTAGAFFDRVLAPLPPDPRPDGAIAICSDAWLDIVEAADPEADSPRRRVRVRVEDGCEHGLAEAYARELADAALRLLPACTAIPAEAGFAELRLAACARLAGDRMAAAQALGVVLRLRDGTEPDRLNAAFASDARLDWVGRATSGAAGAAESWTRNLRDLRASFFPDRLTGETAGRVRVTGDLEYWRDEGSRPMLWTAPVELIVQYSPNDRAFHVVQASVGAFAQARHFCDPDRLEIRCH
jgi:hypothetical protein